MQGSGPVHQSALFRLVFVASRWLRERLSATGLRVVIMTAFSAALGVNTELNLAHMIFSLGFSLLAVDATALALQSRRVPCLSAHRLLPEFVTFGQATHYRIVIRNEGLRPTRSAALVERLAQPWPAPESVHHMHDHAAKKRFRRGMGYPAFLSLMRRLRALDVDRVELAALLPSHSVEIMMPAQPTARGLAVFEALSLVIQGPLGLVEHRIPVTIAPATLPVLPQRLAVELPRAAGNRLLQPGGVALAQHVGDAEEFRSLRDYRPGDPLRSIHWRSFARTGKPVVREFQEEFFSRHTLVLDTAAPYPFAATFEAAVSMAAWLVARPRDSDAMLDLMFVGDRVHRLTSGRSLGSSDALLRVLATVTPSAPDSIAVLLSTLEKNAAQVSSVVAIFQIWDEPRQHAVRRLIARGLWPTVLVVESTERSASDEDDADFAGVLHRISVAAGASGSLPV
jgi:hypothetical protein